MRWDRAERLAVDSKRCAASTAAITRRSRAAVKDRGSSLADEQYVDLFGRPGEYQDHHQVYGREGESCHRCRRPIHRARYSNRSTFYCDACQV